MRKRYLVLCLLLLMFLAVFVKYDKGHFVFDSSDSFVSDDVIASLSDSDLDQAEDDVISNLKLSYNNDEIVGLLRIPNSNMEVPITQSDDNDKYLYTDAHNKYDKKGNPFLDYRVDINTSKKLLIYGHNSKKYVAPFKTLENYYDKDYYDNHQYIELVTDSNVFKYKIFSVYVEPEDWSYMKIEYKDDLSRFKELEKHKSKSMYDTGEDIAQDDDILILQTCSYKEEYSKYSKKYLLVISRRVK